MSKSDTAMRKLCKKLGEKYTITVIDWEKVIYRDFGNGFNIEISGVHTSSPTKKANIYLWFGERLIVNSIFGVSREKIGETADKLLAISESLINGGYDNDTKLYELLNNQNARKILREKIG